MMRWTVLMVASWGGRGPGGFGLGAGRRSSVGGYADARRISFGSTYTPAARQSTFGAGAGLGRSRGFSAGSSGYKRRRSILSDEDLTEESNSDDEARSLTAQFEDNNALQALSSPVEDDLDDGWESERDYSSRLDA